MTAGDIKIRTGIHKDWISGVVLNGADDSIKIDAVASAEAGAANVKGTISGWICIPDITGTYSMFCLGDTDADERLCLQVAAGKLQAVDTDGGVAQWQVTSTNVVIAAHRWTHICLVHNGVRPYLYVDGVAVAMTDNVNTDLTEWCNGLTGLDVGRIGYNMYNNVLADDFKGGVAYVKYATGIITTHNVWSANDVLQEYNYRAGYGIGTGVTKGVLALWTCAGTVVDPITGGGTYDGTLDSDAQYDSEYSELTSKLRLLAPVVADDICLLPRGMDGSVTAVVVKNA